MSRTLESMWRKTWLQVTLLTLLALGIRLAWGFARLSMGLEFVDEGDFPLYQIGAAHILSQGDLTNSLFLVRPPGFPLLVALLNMNNTLILLVNAILGALLTPLTVILSRQLRLPIGVALAAGAIVAFDPLTIQYTAFLGPEALAFVSALAMMICLLALVRSPSNRVALLWGAGAGGLLLISVYARPSIYLLWLPLVIWLMAMNRRRWFALALYVFISLAGMQVWVQHNAQVFGNPTFSTVGAYTMTYYRAVSVAHLAANRSVDEVELDIARRIERELGHDPALADEDSKHAYLAASPEVQQALYKVNLEIFLEYPLVFLATLPLGFIRLYSLAPPLDALGNLQYYPLVLWNWLVLILCAYGLYKAARERRWALFWLVTILVVYFTAGTLLVKSAGLSGRERTIHFPYMAIICAYGLSQVWQPLRQRMLSRRAAEPQN